jgi:UDP-N-acetylmuramoyl-tripeptide--D-alanyl-D-alanine ligase
MNQAHHQTNPSGAMMTLHQAWQWLLPRIPTARLVGDGTLRIQRVHTDSRTLQNGDLFVALKGERFDANAFLAEAKTSGAVAAIAHGGLADAGLSGIEVPHTTLALGALAAGWRAQFSLPLIAVTGSNGKTTVTQMIAAILHADKPGRTLATAGNFNNDIGVPLTLLRLRAEHELAVVELGMNHPGEIAYLADITRPTVALVNNAQREHLEFMATVQAVAQENGAVIALLPADGVAVFPADDDHTGVWMTLASQHKTLQFGLSTGALHCDEPEWQNSDGDSAWAVRAHTPQGSISYRLHIAGRHNVKNSLAALACATAAGVSLESAAQGLSAFEPVKGRSRALSLNLGERSLTVVDDTYNANPDSVRAAIDVLTELPSPRLLVLGDMGEVGDQGPQFHAEVGHYAQERGIEMLLALGDLAQHAVTAFNVQAGHATQSGAGQHFSHIDALNAAVWDCAQAQVRSIVVKGSRFMKMERVVATLQTKVSPC